MNNLNYFSKKEITLENFSADGVGNPIQTDGGVFVISCENSTNDGDVDFGGGTITLQTSVRGGGFQDVYASDGTLLEINAANNYASRIRLESKMQIRATLAGATSPSVTVKLV